MPLIYSRHEESSISASFEPFSTAENREQQRNMTQLRASSRKLLLAVVLGMFSLTAHAEVHRDPAVMREFMKAHPCPDGPDKGSTKRCAQHQKDHIVPLECGGADAIENLQWLSVEDHRAKTRIDNAQCRYLTLPNPLKPQQEVPPLDDPKTQ